MKSCHGVIVFLCILSITPEVALPQTAVDVEVDFPPKVVLNGGDIDLIVFEAGQTDIQLFVMAIDNSHYPPTDDLGEPISIPILFKVIEHPPGASGWSFTPGGLDSALVYTEVLGSYALTYFNAGPDPGVYLIEASSPYSDQSHVFTMWPRDYPCDIDVYLTAPSAVVDSTLGVDVDITVDDCEGNPVDSLDLVATCLQGMDIKQTYPVFRTGIGTYTAHIASTIADSAMIVVTDTVSGLEGTTEAFHYGNYVEFLKAPPDSIYADRSGILFTDVADGEDAYYIFRSYLHDTFGNKYDSTETSYSSVPLAGISVQDSVWMEDDYYSARLKALDVGSEVLFIEDLISGIALDVPFEFPAVIAHDPDEPVWVGETITIPLDVYLADPLDTLGSYNFDISFNADALSLIGVSDGDPDDGFDAPVVTMLNDSTFNIYQVNTRYGPGDTRKRIQTSGLDFVVTGEGALRLEIQPGVPIGTGLSTTTGKEVPSTPVSKPKKKAKVKKTLKLKIFAEDKSGVDKAEIKKDIEHAQKVFDENYKKCCAIKITWDGTIETFKRKDYDLDNDGKLDDFTDSKLTKEEKALIKNTKAKRDTTAVNVYYMKNNCTPRRGMVTYGEALTVKRFGKKNSSVVMAKGCRDYGSTLKDKDKKPVEKGLAHELAHILGEIPDIAGRGTDKLMEYNNKGKSDSGVKLTTDECKKIMDKGKANGFLK